tara:strand:+ start:2338 stop:3168 length:831 start_codon:yes stop_codon:yes gene_type:complete
MRFSILSWNVAGLRARVKLDDNMNNSLSNALFNIFDKNEELIDIDIVCLQETKCMEKEVKLPEDIINKYPYRYWNSTDGISQRKGLSGTCIWCKNEPIRIIDNPEFDVEGRITSVEFDEFILVNVYVPNSQKLDSDRFNFRSKWNNDFIKYILELQKHKNVIICGDMNVAHLDLDINNPKSKKNKIAGFFDFERLDFAYMIETLNLTDVFRTLNPNKQKSTYWSNFMKCKRNKYNGWGIDYFLVSNELFNKDNINTNICTDIMGSDHCPIILDITV